MAEDVDLNLKTDVNSCAVSFIIQTAINKNGFNPFNKNSIFRTALAGI
ncbi:MAG: hypothetical protein MUW56_03690 [Chryseobacterium sp.]|nr:hypothetical protein [Chryseobacterium sp.]MCJ7932748.1 hypothetical protein [Chryseobacterium sp.]